MSKGGLSPDQVEAAFSILSQLSEQPESIDFQEPVDFLALELLDYPEVITQPMDLGTIRDKLEEGLYESIYEFMEDLQLVWKNCKTYNKGNSTIVQRAKKLERIAIRWFAQFHDEESSESSEDEMSEEEEESESEDAEISFEEKVDLAEKIRRLDSKVMADIIFEVKKACPDAIQDFGKDKIKVSLETLDREAITVLWEIVENDLEDKRKKEMAEKLRKLVADDDEEESDDDEEDEEEEEYK